MSPGLSIDCPVCDGRAGEPCITRAGKPTRTHVERVKAETTVTTGPDADPTPPASESIGLDAWLNGIHQGDALGLMKQMPDGCVDLVFTSPPYNLRNSTGGQGGNRPRDKWTSTFLRNGYRNHSDNMRVSAYIEWQRACVREAARLVAPNGAIFYNHRRRVQNDVLEDHARHIIDAAEEFGLMLRQEITWYKGSGFNHNPGYYLPSCEQIYLLARPGEFRHRPVGRINNVWEIGRQPRPDHPALSLTVPFPVALVRMALDPIGDLTDTLGRPGVVLDPFIGSGTTAVAALEAGWHYIGLDNDLPLVEYARERVLAVVTPPTEFVTPLVTPPEAVVTPPTEFVTPLVTPPEAVVTPPAEFVTPLVTPPVSDLTDRAQTLIKFIQEASEKIGGGPPVLRREEMIEGIPMPKNTLDRALKDARMAGCLVVGETSQRRRGARVYYLAGVHPYEPIAFHAPVPPWLHVGLQVGLQPAGRPVLQRVGLQVGLQTGLQVGLQVGLQPAGRFVTPPNEASPSCPACGPTPVCVSEIMSDRGVPGVTWYCAGRGQQCGWVWHYAAGGQVRAPDEPRFDDYSMLVEFLNRCLRGLPGEPTAEDLQQETRSGYLDGYRKRYGRLPWESDDEHSE